jgi:diguanylate cyclase (GGDEF)-like protein/PAS domain S-box-containing protein
MCGASAWLGVQNYNQAHARMDQQTATLVRTVADHTASTLQLADYALEDMRAHWLAGPVPFAEALARNQRRLSDLAIQTSIINADGALLYTDLGPIAEHLYFGDREYFKVHKNATVDQLFVGPPNRGRVSGKWSIHLTRPLLKRGQFAGVIVLSVDPRFFAQHYESVDLGRQGLVSMVSDGGEIMARSLEHDAFVGKTIDDIPFMAPGAALQGHFHRVSPLDGVSRSYSYVRLPQYHLTMLAAVGVQEQLVPLYQQWAYLGGIALLVLLLMLYAARSMLKSIALREMSEQRLKESQERYRGLVEWSPVSVVVHQSGKIVYANPAAVATLGAQSASELIGNAAMERIHPDYRQVVLDRMNAGLRGQTYVSPVHEKFLQLNGTVIDVEVQGSVIPFEGAPAIQVTFQDITGRIRMLESLHASEEKWRTIIANSTDGISIVAMDGLVEKSSRGALVMFGYASEDELVGKRLLDFIDPSGHAVANQLIVDLLQGKLTGLVEIACIRKDGTRFFAESKSDMLRNAHGEPTHMIFITRDVTKRKQAEDALKLAASVFTHAREGIVITDASGAIVSVNETFTHITGYSGEEVQGCNPRLLNSGRQSPAFYAEMWRSISVLGHWTGEVWNRRKNGEVFAELLTIRAVRDSAGATQNFVSLFTDITPMKEHQQQLEHIAHYDALTGLPNRVLLADRLQQGVMQSQRRGRSLAVVYLDLDGFKSVNDRYGHAMGDELLIALARRMKTALREGDTLARVGGDEFVAVLVDLEHVEDCEPVLARLLHSAAEPLQVPLTVAGVLSQVELHLSASMGVALYPQDGDDAGLLMRNAARAMYLAKQAGKNRYQLFDLAHDLAVKTQRESIDQIRSALERHEFLLFYQPKVNMRTGEVVGAEALIRWQHPVRGLLPPGAFLPIIENEPISLEVGEWVIETALAQMTAWRAAGLDMAVSVNIGALQLQQVGFTQCLGELLARHPTVPRYSLELEILETSALKDITQVSNLMHACREMGVRFALDDFGTGYSSLIYLKHLPAETLKIDQGFVRDMMSDPDDLAIVNGVIGLARAFGRQVIAEGVETSAHGDLLMSIGCDLGQGYGIARPMPAGDMPLWVAHWRLDTAP